MKGEFYKMDWEAWDEGTVELTLEEEAAYLRLCHQMYRRGGPVPNSPKLLSVIWRCHANKAKPLLERLVQKGKILVTPDGHLTNTRVTHELHNRHTRSTTRSDAGHTGGIRSGEARRNRLKNNDPTEAIASSPAKQNEAEERRGEEIRGESNEPRAREDGGGRPAAAVPGPTPSPQHLTTDGLIERLIAAAEGNVVHGSAGIEFVGPIRDLQAMGCDLELDVLPVIRTRIAPMDEPLKTWGARWLRDAVLEHQARRLRGRGAKRPAEPKEAEWRRKLTFWWNNGTWLGAWGNSPDEGRCEIPTAFIEKFKAENPKPAAADAKVSAA